jgi:hypothetical protein
MWALVGAGRARLLCVGKPVRSRWRGTARGRIARLSRGSERVTDADHRDEQHGDSNRATAWAMVMNFSRKANMASFAPARLDSHQG